ncbi:MAG: tetratricopeptide repeat protein [Phycisphaeraceae bacterium]
MNCPRRSSCLSGHRVVLPLLVAMLLSVGCASSNDRHGFAEWTAPPPEPVSNRPPTPRTLSAMARILAAQGKYEEAVFVLQRLLEEHPEYIPAYNDLAEIHLSQGDMTAAVDVLEEAITLAPEDPVLLNNRGVCYLFQDEPATALPWFEEALRAAPGHDRARANVAVALGLMGEYERAYDLYDQFLTPAVSRYNVGVLAESRNDYNRALREYEQAHALNERLSIAADMRRVDMKRRLHSDE